MVSFFVVVILYTIACTFAGSLFAILVRTFAGSLFAISSALSLALLLIISLPFVCLRIRFALAAASCSTRSIDSRLLNCLSQPHRASFAFLSHCIVCYERRNFGEISIGHSWERITLPFPWVTHGKELRHLHLGLLMG